jgi:hypothetical protein
MSAMECEELREVAAELALATSPGKQRAAALAHIDGCADCRLVVEELSDAADALLLLAPEAEPPAGFAGRVLSGLGPSRPSRWRDRARVAAVAAAVLSLGVATAIGVRHEGAPLSRPSSALRAPGVRVARFVSGPGEHVQGEVFAAIGRPSSVFMTVSDEGSSDIYRCELELDDGQLIEIGRFQLHDGSGSWGMNVATDLHQLKAVRLLDEHGAPAARASLA